MNSNEEESLVLCVGQKIALRIGSYFYLDGSELCERVSKEEINFLKNGVLWKLFRKDDEVILSSNETEIAAFADGKFFSNRILCSENEFWPFVEKSINVSEETVKNAWFSK